MKYAVTVPNFGDFFDPRTLAQIAREAETAGWDGFFLWDHVQFIPTPTVDPWIALAAIALAAERVRIGTLVTPLPRRRPVNWPARPFRSTISRTAGSSWASG